MVKSAPGISSQVLSVPDLYYLIYLESRGPTTINLKLASGPSNVEWLNVESGECSPHSTVTTAQTNTSIPSPHFTSEVAVRIFR